MEKPKYVPPKKSIVRRIHELGATDKSLESFCIWRRDAAEDEADLVSGQVLLHAINRLYVEPTSRCQPKLIHIGRPNPGTGRPRVDQECDVDRLRFDSAFCSECSSALVTDSDLR